MVMDLGFCVLDGIIKLKKLSVHGSTVVKKWRYWPRFIQGELIKEHMEKTKWEHQTHFLVIGKETPFTFFAFANRTI